MGRRGGIVEDSINSDILDVIRPHRAGITFGELRKETKSNFSKDTLWRHLDYLVRVQAVSNDGKFYSISRCLDPQVKIRHTPVADAKLLPYVGLLLAISSITARYLNLLQGIVDAPDLDTAGEMAGFFLKNAVNSDSLMGLVRDVWKSRASVRFERLIGRQLTLKFVKGQPPGGGVGVEGCSDRSIPS